MLRDRCLPGAERRAVLHGTSEHIADEVLISVHECGDRGAHCYGGAEVQELVVELGEGGGEGVVDQGDLSWRRIGFEGLSSGFQVLPARLSGGLGGQELRASWAGSGD